MDKNLTSMQNMFKRLNLKGTQVDISTFSKASKHRSQETFIKNYSKLAEKVRQKKPTDKYRLGSGTWRSLEKWHNCQQNWHIPGDRERFLCIVSVVYNI